MNIFLRCTLSAICLFSSMVYAASPAEDLSMLLNTVHSMRASFAQTIYDNRGKAIQRSYGRMAFERPGKFRWEVTKPIPQLIIASESRLWIYDPDLQQVTVRSLHKATGETPALLLSHESTVLEKDFTVKVLQKNSPAWRWFTLIPKKSENMFTSIQMGFLNNQIHKMRLQDNLGHTTVIQYQNTAININFSSSEFTFKPPAGVDVINETHKR